ncbi:hypothetical protein [Burkholderia anthina]|nr:hypothetical protein [Burkholderia anthina]
MRITWTGLTLKKVDIAEHEICSAVALTQREFADESGIADRAEK